MICRYLQGPKPDAYEHNSSPAVPGTGRGLGMDTNMNNAWHVLPSQVHSSSFLKPRIDSNLQGNSNMHVPRVYERDDAAMTSQQQHFFFGNDSSSLGPVKQKHHSMRLFLDECPKARESWPELDDRCKKNVSATTQLSISIPVAPSGIFCKDWLPRW